MVKTSTMPTRALSTKRYRLLISLCLDGTMPYSLVQPLFHTWAGLYKMDLYTVPMLLQYEQHQHHICHAHATIESNQNSNYNKDSAMVATFKNEELAEEEEKKKEGGDKRQGRGADNNNNDNSNDMTITMTLPQ